MGVAELMNKIRNDGGFTIVELLIVMIVSSIMLIGMVGLLSMGFQAFSDGRTLQAITDASRRALPAMDRQMKSLLHINDAECVASYKVSTPEGTPEGVWNGISFYSDIDNDNATASVENYTVAEKIEFYLDTNHNLVQRTTQPGTPPVVGPPTTLCSYVESFRIYYFSPGISPGNGSPLEVVELALSEREKESLRAPGNRYQRTDLNSGVGSIKIVIQMKNGKMTRTFEQTTFLRICDRSDTGV